MPLSEVQEKILRLKKEKNALILAHNYQGREVQEIADFAGDSLELAKKARDFKEKIVVFCGVDFMAETTKILSPEKKVLMPSPGAKCPLAKQLSAEQLKEAQERFPEAKTVLYVNSGAETKALADSCCTSANAEKIVNAMDSETVLFGPDHNLAYYVQKRSGKKIVPVPEDGICPTHHFISEDEVLEQKRLHPKAKIIAHPECVPEVQAEADFIASTSGMVKIAKENPAAEFIVATEKNMLIRLEREAPGKTFYPASGHAICPTMRMITIEKVLESLEEEKFEVEVDGKISGKARKAIEKMFELTV